MNMRVISIRELEAACRSAGGTLLRHKGSHQVWRLGNGEQIVLLVKGRKDYPLRHVKNVVAALVRNGVTF